MLVIAASGMFSATITACAAVLQVNTATMKVEVSIHGMRAPPRSVPSMQSAAATVLAPGSGHLVLPTDNSMLQFWDTTRDCHVDKLQVRHQGRAAFVMEMWSDAQHVACAMSEGLCS